MNLLGLQSSELLAYPGNFYTGVVMDGALHQSIELRVVVLRPPATLWPGETFIFRMVDDLTGIEQSRIHYLGLTGEIFIFGTASRQSYGQ